MRTAAFCPQTHSAPLARPFPSLLGALTIYPVGLAVLSSQGAPPGSPHAPPKSTRTAQAAAINPAKSAQRAAGTAYRVFTIPAAPKYTAMV